MDGLELHGPSPRGSHPLCSLRKDPCIKTLLNIVCLQRRNNKSCLVYAHSLCSLRKDPCIKIHLNIFVDNKETKEVRPGILSLTLFIVCARIPAFNRNLLTYFCKDNKLDEGACLDPKIDTFVIQSSRHN